MASRGGGAGFPPWQRRPTILRNPKVQRMRYLKGVGRRFLQRALVPIRARLAQRARDAEIAAAAARQAVRDFIEIENPERSYSYEISGNRTSAIPGLADRQAARRSGQALIPPTAPMWGNANITDRETISTGRTQRAYRAIEHNRPSFNRAPRDRFRTRYATHAPAGGFEQDELEALGDPAPTYAASNMARLQVEPEDVTPAPPHWMAAADIAQPEFQAWWASMTEPTI